MVALSIVTLCLTLAGCQSDSDRQSENRSSGDGRAGPKDSIELGVNFLTSLQSADGVWRSEYYGNLKQGAATTALVLFTLAHLQDTVDEWPEAEFANGMRALQANILDRGFVTNEDGPDYSNYGSAMYLLASKEADFYISQEIKSKLVEYLQAAQLDEAAGYENTDRDFGGWDLAGWITGQRQTTGTNISVSAAVIEALSHFSEDADCLQKADDWLAKCQNSDGGFFFHPKVDHDGNKAGWSSDDRQVATSYGTASVDGLRALGYLKANRDISDDRIDPACKWITDRVADQKSLQRVPGFTEDHAEGWAMGLRFYYWYSLSRSLELAFEDEDARQRVASDLAEQLLAMQNKDGSWQNPNARMREDDPLIATCFALIALKHCRQITGD